jgi:hypothetical protein
MRNHWSDNYTIIVYLDLHVYLQYNHSTSLFAGPTSAGTTAALCGMNSLEAGAIVEDVDPAAEPADERQGTGGLPQKSLRAFWAKRDTMAIGSMPKPRTPSKAIKSDGSTGAGAQDSKSNGAP